jgi:hypothetical protein
MTSDTVTAYEGSDSFLIESLIHLLKDLQGNYIVPMTVGQFLGVEGHIGNVLGLTVNGHNVDLEVPHLVPDGPLCTFFYTSDTGDYSDILTMDAQIEVHTNQPILTLVRLGEFSASIGTFSKTFPIKSNFLNWPNKVEDIWAQSKVVADTRSQDDYTLVAMYMSEYLAIRDKIGIIDGMLVNGTSLDYKNHEVLALEPVNDDSSCEYVGTYPTGHTVEIHYNTVVKVAVKSPEMVINALANLRKGV